MVGTWFRCLCRGGEHVCLSPYLDLYLYIIQGIHMYIYMYIYTYIYIYISLFYLSTPNIHMSHELLQRAWHASSGAPHRGAQQLASASSRPCFVSCFVFRFVFVLNICLFNSSFCCLARSRSLTDLDLSRNSIGDQGAEAPARHHCEARMSGHLEKLCGEVLPRPRSFFRCWTWRCGRDRQPGAWQAFLKAQKSHSKR